LKITCLPSQTISGGNGTAGGGLGSGTATVPAGGSETIGYQGFFTVAGAGASITLGEPDCFSSPTSTSFTATGVIDVAQAGSAHYG